MGFEVELGRHESCKLDLLQLAADAVLVAGSSCLSTAVGCSSGTVVVARETVEIVVFGASRFVGSANTAANEYSSSIGPARVTGCAERNRGLLLLRWIVCQVLECCMLYREEKSSSRGKMSL